MARSVLHELCVLSVSHSAPFALFPLCLALTLALFGCHQDDPQVCPGPTRYLSNRAVELELQVSGELQGLPIVPQGGPSFTAQVRQDLRTLDASWVERGRPLMLDRAALGPGGIVAAGAHGYLANLVTFVSANDPGAEDAPFDEYLLPDDRVRAVAGSKDLRGARPDIEALAADGVLRVSALFGQMNPEGLRSDDEGWWSKESFEAGLQLEGFAVERPRAWNQPSRFVRESRGLRVEVSTYGPDQLPLGLGGGVGELVVSDAIRDAEVVYLDIHARQPALAALAESETWKPSRYRIVVIDACWSYSLNTKPVLDATPEATTQVVNVEGRVVTGSVASFSSLFHAVLAGAEAAAQRSEAPQPRWVDIIREMNRLAQERADARREVVDENLRLPEIYGVSGL